MSLLWRNRIAEWWWRDKWRRLGSKLICTDCFWETGRWTREDFAEMVVAALDLALVLKGEALLDLVGQTEALRDGELSQTDVVECWHERRLVLAPRKYVRAGRINNSEFQMRG